MKKTIITIIIFLFSLSAFSQTQQQKDSITIAEQNKKVFEIITKTPIKEFHDWLYKNLLADKYNEFLAPWYNAFVEYKLSQLPKEDKTKKPSK